MPVVQLEYILTFFILFLVSTVVVDILQLKSLSKDAYDIPYVKTSEHIIKNCIYLADNVNGTITCYIPDISIRVLNNNTLLVNFRTYNDKFEITHPYRNFYLSGQGSDKVNIYKINQTIYIK